MIGDVGNSETRADTWLDALVDDDKQERLCPQLDVFRCGIRLHASVDAVLKFYIQKQDSITGLNSWKNIYLRMHVSGNHGMVMERLGGAGVDLSLPDAF